MTGRTALPGVYVVADPIVVAYAARWALEQRTAACADMARTVVRHAGVLAVAGHAVPLIEAIDAWLAVAGEVADPLAVGDAGEWAIARDVLARATANPHGHMWLDLVAGRASTTAWSSGPRD